MLFLISPSLSFCLSSSEEKMIVFKFSAELILRLFLLVVPSGLALVSVAFVISLLN